MTNDRNAKQQAGTDKNDTQESPKSPIIETTPDAVSLARKLMRLARHGAISVLEPKSGYPIVTRTNCVLTLAGEPVFLMSDLAAHAKALKADARSAILIGEPGKGDPLAHPRITVIGTTQRVKTQESKELEEHLRTRYLNRHPKAELYNSLPDFFIYRMKVERALLNAGFGKAYEISREDLLLAETAADALASVEARIVNHMNEDHGDAIQHYAETLCRKNPGNWQLTACDPEGVDLMAGDETARLLFAQICSTASEVRTELVTLAKKDKSSS